MSVKKLSASQHFRRALWQKKGVFFEAMLITVVVNLLGLAVAMFSMQVYDRVIPNNGVDTLIVLTIGVFIAILFDLLLRQTRMMLVDKASKSLDTQLSETFFDHAMRIRMDQRPATVGTFAAQIRMFESVRQFMTSTTLFLIADVPFALIFIVIIYLIAGPLAIVPLVLLPLTLIIGLLFIRPVARLSIANAQESNIKNGLLIESIDGIESIKGLNAQPNFLGRWNEMTEVIGRNDLQLKKWSGLSSNLSQFVQQVSYIGLVVFGVYQISAGELTMGALIAVTIIGGRALTPLAQVAHVVVQWQQAKAAMHGLESLMQTPMDGELPAGIDLVSPDHAKGQVFATNLNFTYDNQFNVLRVEQFALLPAEKVAIVGGIGSGKSTLLKLLSGMYLPSEGRIYFDDVDMAHLSPEFVRQHVYYLPQQGKLFNGTLKDNLLLGLESYAIGDSQLLEAAQKTGLDKLIQAHPRGLGLQISEGGRGLSGGQQQLLVLTQLTLRLSVQPIRILLLDEPTSALDGQTELSMMTRLFDQIQALGIAVVFVTHKLSQLSFADRIVVMDKGRFVADGPRAEILPRLAGGNKA